MAHKMVDTPDIIVRKYQQNIRGLFFTLRKMMDTAESKGYQVLPRSIFDTAESIILEKDNIQSMISLSVNMSSSGCVEDFEKKNVNFFRNGWKSFIGNNTHPILVEIASKALDVYDDSGELAFSKEDIEKTFGFFMSLYKVSLKMVLAESGIDRVEKVDDMNFYHLKTQLRPELDSGTLSYLLHKYRVQNIPTC